MVFVPCALKLTGAVYAAPFNTVLPTPDVASVGVRVTATALVYQPLEPSVPLKDEVVVGATVSILKEAFWVVSLLPERD